MNAHPLVRLFEKEKFLVLGGLVLSLLMCAGYLIFLYVPMYATEARVFIRNIPREDVVAEYGGGQSLKTESGYSNPLFNYQQILASERLASTVYAQYRKRYPDDLKTLGAFEHVDFLDAYPTMVTSKVLPSTDVLKVSFKWPNKAHAPQAALMLVDGFKRVNLEIQQGISSKQNKNLSAQVDDITQELTDVREALKAFRIENHTVDLDREMEALTDTRVNMERELEVTKADMAFNARKAQEFRRMLNLQPGQSVLAATSVGIDPLLVEVNQRLAEANQRLGKLKSTFTEAYPEVRSVQSEIASLNQTIQKRQQEVLGKQKGASGNASASSPRGIYDGPSSTIAVQLAQAEAEESSIGAKLGALQQGITELRSRESAMPLKQMGLDELLKKEEALKSAYENVRKKQIEAQIKEQILIDNLVVLDRPSPASLELKPLAIQLLGFLAFGLFIGLGSAWVKEGIQDQWGGAQEIETATGKTILGQLPWLKKLNGERLFGPDSPMGRGFSSVSSALIQRSYLEQAQVISFISTSEVRAGSFIVSNIAMSLAAADRDVLLIDTDFLNPRRHLNELGIVPKLPKTGFVEAITYVNRALRLNQKLNGDLEAIIRSAIIPIEVPGGRDGVPGKPLHYLSASEPEGRIYEYVASRGFTEILGYLKKHYEFVLVDTPSTPSSFPEAYTIGNMAEGVVVLSAMKSSRDKMLRLVKLLNNSRVKTLGVVAREA